MPANHGGKREGAGRPRVGEIQLRSKIPAAQVGSIEAFGEGKGLNAGLRLFIDFSLSVVEKELRPNVHARYRAPENIRFDDFVAPLREPSSVHNLYGSLRDVPSVKGRLPFGRDRTLWIVVPGGRISAPTEVEYERDAGTMLDALREAGINCRWIAPS